MYNYTSMKVRDEGTEPGVSFFFAALDVDLQVPVKINKEVVAQTYVFTQTIL